MNVLKKTHIRLMSILAFMVLLDQSIKLCIYHNHMDKSLDLLFGFVRFEPKFNKEYSWLNNLFDLGISKAAHIMLNVLALILFWLFFCYIREMHNCSRLTNFIFICVLSGFICSLADKIFWDGSLDFIQLRGLFTFDLKDLYLTVFEVAVIAMLIFNYRNMRSIDEKQVARDFIRYTKNLFKRN